MRISLNILLVSFCTGMLFACNSGSEQNNGSREGREGSTASAANVAEEEEDPQEEKVIMFFGNSLTAGYGLDPSESFPSLIQERLDSLGYSWKVVNAGLSGETTSGGNSRIDWVLERQPVDVFVLELGANDGLRGIDPATTKANLKEIIQKVRKENPEAEIVLAGMMVPPSMGNEYSNRFSKIFPEVAEEEEVTLIPFLLENVAGERELNQGDGIHPTAEGAKIVADNVWDVLKEVLEDTQA